jgi:Conserved in the green lineage and diatoms 27
MNQINICPVPQIQRPINEYKALKNSFNFTWTLSESKYFFKDLSLIFLFLIGFSSIIVTNNHNWEIYLVKSILEIFSSSLFLCFLILCRFYLAWSYIYKRLMNATVSYEESGWYDGQTWVKTTEILLQDKLIGTYELLPKINRLKITLRICIILLSISVFIFSKI